MHQLTPAIETTSEPPRLVYAKIEDRALLLPLWHLEEHGMPTLGHAEMIAMGLADARQMMARVRTSNRRMR